MMILGGILFKEFGQRPKGTEPKLDPPKIITAPLPKGAGAFLIASSRTRFGNLSPRQAFSNAISQMTKGRSRCDNANRIGAAIIGGSIPSRLANSHNCVCTATNPQTEDNPAVSIPLNRASVSSDNNTVASLNNPSLQGIARHPSRLEQDGIRNPHCLIATHRSVEPKIRSNRC